MRQRFVFAALFAAMWFVPGSARADVKPHALIGDGMVLQQGMPCKIWGTADAGEKINVELNLTKSSGVGAETTADKDGKWLVTLPKQAAGGPYTLSIQGKNTITLNDVYVGEVWVCSGQSNMEMSLKGCADSAEHIKNSANPKIRLFTVGHNPADTPQDDVKGGKWVECGPDTVGNFSAVAYFFGRDLQKARNVPVGLIHSSWGGTICEAWTPMPALEAVESLKKEIVEPYMAKNPKPTGPNRPAVLYNGMIHPIEQFTVKGAIWYQGESNAGKPDQYKTLFPTMIKSWRHVWHNDDLGFYFVQLAPFMKIEQQPTDPNWARLR